MGSFYFVELVMNFNLKVYTKKKSVKITIKKSETYILHTRLSNFHTLRSLNHPNLLSGSLLQYT